MLLERRVFNTYEELIKDARNEIYKQAETMYLEDEDEACSHLMHVYDMLTQNKYVCIQTKECLMLYVNNKPVIRYENDCFDFKF